MQMHANLCTQGSGSARGCFDWQLQVCVCWGGTLGSGCFCKVGHDCLSMFYMLWIHRLHTSVAEPLHRTSPSNERGSHPKKLSKHQELSSASSISSMAGSSQSIIIKSMPQLHLAWLCVWAGGGPVLGLFVLILGGVCEWQNSRGADAMLSTLTNGLTERL